MPAFIVALVVLAILSKFFMGLRAYLCFSLLMIGVAGIISGMLGADSLFLYIGIAGVVFSVGAAYLTSLSVEASQRPTQIFRFFVYGLLVFAYVLLLTLLITIPLATAFGRIMDNYREANIVDASGRTVGKAHVNKDLRGADGTQYYSDDAY